MNATAWLIVPLGDRRRDQYPRWVFLFHKRTKAQGLAMSTRTILIVILLLLLLGALPTWPYSAGWGYYPSGGLGAVLVIVLILIVLGVILLRHYIDTMQY